ncbi:ATP-binding cassette domain-containing protein [Amycolatopsis sp. lyj-109]|uniref:ATP-binding cassette domain-containing protein n=1 Tax=Amycolatopsis sp. lyj-109 TaxID=2789287 RepID=UPI00397C0E0B
MTRARGWVSIWPVFVAERRSLLLLACWSVLEMVPVLASGQLVALATDTGFLTGRFGLGLIWLACYGGALVLGAVGTRQVMRPLAEVVEAVRDRLVHAVVAGSLREAVTGGAAAGTSVVTTLTRQTETVRQMVAALLMIVRTVVFSVVAVLVGLLTLAPVLAWITAGALTLAMVLLGLLSPRLKRRYLASMLVEERLAGESGEVLSGLRDVAACGARTVAGRQVGDVVDAQAAASMATARTGAWRIGIIAIGARLPLVAALALAPGLVSSGAATPGEILGAATYLVVGLEPALRSIVGTLGNVGLQLGVLLDRLAAIGASRAQPGRTGAAATGFDLELDAITFAYGPDSEPIVAGLDLRIEHGDHLVIVGPSGIGKSTVAALIAGLEWPQSGTIRLGGVPLAALSAWSLREKVVLVPQESYVFSGTLRENLCYLAPAADDLELDRVVGELGLTHLVGRLGGYDAEIEEAGSLSEGERQLITLARVFLSGAEVVVLDEATCHLDPQAEARAEQAFAARGGTLIVIAHRISSAARARRILLLDGTDATVGDHETLVRVSPLYADLTGRWAAVH